MARVFGFMLSFLAFGLTTPVAAHPHVFVDARTGFTFDDAGRLAGLRITWTYDAFTSLTLFDILDLDRDGDGALDDDDRSAIVAGETVWADDYLGDTYLEMNGNDVALARPLNGSAWMADDRISVGFDLPLAAPLSLTGEVVLRLYDPFYYYAYTVAAVEDEMPAGCDAKLVPFVADAATEELQQKLAMLSREETPEEENVGRLFADEVWLRCG
ncbi:MAG: DUF1007 family protein [Pseudomonadota bacterium]